MNTLRTGRRGLPKDESAFSLIELVVVMIIIGVLATIAIPMFLGQREAASDTAAKSDARNLATIRASYNTDANPEPSLVDLEGQGFTGSPNVTQALCQLSDDEFAVGATHPETGTIWVVDADGHLVKSSEATLVDALGAVLGADCSVGAPTYYQS